MGHLLKKVSPTRFTRRSKSVGIPWPVTWKAPHSVQARPIASRAESRPVGSDPNRSMTGIVELGWEDGEEECLGRCCGD